VRAACATHCDVILGDEVGIVSRLSGVDVLVTLAFNREMAAAAKKLKLVQVPGAGLDRIDRLGGARDGQRSPTPTAMKSASPST